MKDLFTVLLSLGLVGFAFASPYIMSDPNDGIKVLQDQGYTDIKFIGVDYWGCGELRRDQFSFTTVNGKTSTVTVCSSFFKKATLRY